MRGKNNKIKAPFILASIILFNLINTAAWLKLDKSLLRLDSWSYYRYSYEVYQYLKGLFHSNVPVSAIEPMKWHGFLVGFLTAPFYFLFGPGQHVAVLVNTSIFVTVLCLSVYATAKAMMNEKAGLLAAFIACSYPIIFNHMRVYMLDLPLTALVSLSMYFLIASKDLTDTAKTLLFAVSAGLGLIVKFNYGAFVAGPFLVTCFFALKEKNSRRLIISNAGYVCAVILVLGALFYSVKLIDVANRLAQALYAGIFANKEYSMNDIIFIKTSLLLKYLETGIEEGISFLLFAAFIAGSWLFMKQRHARRWVLYSALIVPLFIQNFLLLLDPESQVRYSMPLLSSMAVITAVGISGIKNRGLSRAVNSALIILCIVQFFAVSYGLPILPKKIYMPIQGKDYAFDLVFFEQDTRVPPFLEDRTSHPSLNSWRSQEMLDIIERTNETRQRVKVVILSNIPEIAEGMGYGILVKRQLIDVIPAIDLTMERPYARRIGPLDETVTSANYVIISDAFYSPWEHFLNSEPQWKKRIQKARNAFKDNFSNFKLAGLVILPDNSKAKIYKNIHEIGSMDSCAITSGDLKLAFDSGRARIFYKGVELTKGLGMYASVFALQHWRDSMEASWEVKKTGPNTLEASGRWMFVPVVQTWKIEVKDGHTISCEAQMQIMDELKIDVQDFKLMLVEKYKEWSTSDGKHGTLPDSFEKDLWKTFWAGDPGSEIEVKAAKEAYLPTLKFRLKEGPEGSSASIQNSDQLFNGRVIGAFKQNKPSGNIFPPGTYKYFSADITVDQP